MTPEKTNFITQGYDGMKRLKQGPMLDSYRGLSIIHSRQYSLETGAPPRDLLRRRVRVAEYYRIPWQPSFGNNTERVMIDLYDEAKDTFFTISWKDLLQHAALDEADRVMFEDLGNGQAVNDTNSTKVSFEWNDIDNTDRVSIVRPATWVANPAPGIIITTTTNIARGNSDQLWGALTTDAGGLVLITSNSTKSSATAAYTDDDRRREVQSFYTGSGWFNGTHGAPLGCESLIYYKTLLNVPEIVGRVDIYAAGVNFPAYDARRKAFMAMAMGSITINGGNMTYGHSIDFGLRPNLHIGRMVFANIRPDTMRFKHVAGHIMAQTVVTRPLAIRLMQQVEGAEQHTVGSVPIYRHILYLFGLREEIANTGERHQHFNLRTSVLAYMAAAVLHPNRAVADFCRNEIKKMGLDLPQLGDALVTWIKVFLNSIPTPRGGVDPPIFDAYEQGRVLQATFEGFMAKDPEYPEGVLSEQDRNRLPVIYLGEYVNDATAEAAYESGRNSLAGRQRDDSDRVYGATQVPKWGDGPNNDRGIYRDVNEATFSKRRAYIFPGGNQRIKPQDIMAVNKTATAQDALIAFVTIMCKRFFTSRQEMYVEMAQDNEVANIANPGVAPKQNDVGIRTTRRALTSNEYPTVHFGQSRLLESPNQWEIVIVRPNIEHNMLAAVLGRGGIEDLGATFWGQVCDPRSMLPDRDAFLDLT